MNGRELEARIRAVASEDTEVVLVTPHGQRCLAENVTLEWKGDHYTLVLYPERSLRPEGETWAVDETGHVMTPEHMR